MCNCILAYFCLCACVFFLYVWMYSRLFSYVLLCLLSSSLLMQLLSFLVVLFVLFRYAFLFLILIFNICNFLMWLWRLCRQTLIEHGIIYDNPNKTIMLLPWTAIIALFTFQRRFFCPVFAKKEQRKYVVKLYDLLLKSLTIDIDIFEHFFVGDINDASNEDNLTIMVRTSTIKERSFCITQSSLIT